ncbi:hypothetical protein ABK040_007881 [Willaertia magna]
MSQKELEDFVFENNTLPSFLINYTSNTQGEPIGFFHSIIRNSFNEDKSNLICLEKHIVNQFKEQVLIRNTNNTKQVHSYLIRFYVEGLVDGTLKEWKKNINDTSLLQQFLISTYENPILSELFNDTRFYIYTTEKGFFYLSKETKQNFDIPIYYMKIQWNDDCFNLWGGLGHFFPYLLNFFIGYDSIMLNTFVKFNEEFNHNRSINSGMVYTKQYDEVYYLRGSQIEYSELDKLLARLSPLIIYFVTFILVYYLLRTTHLNIFNLLIDVQVNVFIWRRLLKAFLKHLFQNIMFIPVLLGVVGFIDQFFNNDQKISLLLFCLIWLSQIFMNNMCNTRQTKSYFPYLLHSYCLIYIFYYFRYGPSFTYLAYCCCFTFVLNGILYFWNNYEYFYLINTNPILRDFIRRENNDFDNNALDRLFEQNGIPMPILPQQQRIANIQQWVFNLNDNMPTMEQRIGRFNIRVTLANNPPPTQPGNVDNNQPQQQDNTTDLRNTTTPINTGTIDTPLLLPTTDDTSMINNPSNTETSASVDDQQVYYSSSVEDEEEEVWESEEENTLTTN